MGDKKASADEREQGLVLKQAARELRAVYEQDPEMTAFNGLDAIEWDIVISIDTPPQTPYN